MVDLGLCWTYFSTSLLWKPSTLIARTYLNCPFGVGLHSTKVAARAMAQRVQDLKYMMTKADLLYLTRSGEIDKKLNLQK